MGFSEAESRVRGNGCATHRPQTTNNVLDDEAVIVSGADNKSNLTCKRFVEASDFPEDELIRKPHGTELFESAPVLLEKVSYAR